MFVFPAQVLHVFQDKLAVTDVFNHFPTLKQDVFFYFGIFIIDKVNWHGLSYEYVK
jgi:hypothetical protein